MDILAVLVLYKMNLEDSPTYQSLLTSVKAGNSQFSSLKLIIYDNSPNPQVSIKDIPVETIYVHDSDNGGLVAAYNYALCEAQNKEWMLLLDQDTILPQNFISNIIKNDNFTSMDESIVAIVPKVRCNKLVVSPAQVAFAGRMKSIANYIGKHNQPITAINSGALIKTSFMQEIGGFNKVFKLDFLDHWLFHKIYSLGRTVYVSESVLEHELSVSNFEKSITPERYENILLAEWHFYQLYKSKLEVGIYIIRNAIRAIYRFAVVKDKKISLVLIRHFLM